MLAFWCGKNVANYAATMHDMSCCGCPESSRPDLSLEGLGLEVSSVLRAGWPEPSIHPVSSAPPCVKFFPQQGGHPVRVQVWDAGGLHVGLVTAADK